MSISGSAQIAGEIDALPAKTAAALRTIRRRYSQQLASSPPAEILRIADELVARHAGEYRFLAYELLRHHEAALASLTAADVRRLGRGMDSWGAVDCFAIYISGQAWRRGQITEAEIRRWSVSEDRWWRRAALVSTVPLNSRAHGGEGDPKATLSVCRRLLRDRDPMVVKALSWALRELSKRDPSAVRQFLDQNESALAPPVLREVRNKLTTGLKNPRASHLHS
jgi:3-methyladenine DNA glycosylase AlkD